MAEIRRPHAAVPYTSGTGGGAPLGDAHLVEEPPDSGEYAIVPNDDDED